MQKIAWSHGTFSWLVTLAIEILGMFKIHDGTLVGGLPVGV